MKTRVAFCLVAVMAVLAVSRHYQLIEINSAAIITAAALASQPTRLSDAQLLISTAGDTPCRLYWLKGLLANATGTQDKRDESWENLVDCAPEFIKIVRRMAPDHRGLAQRAVEKQPATAESWFWLASIAASEDDPSAVDLYREGLRQSPRDGRRWQELADILVKRDQLAAMEAYLQSCLNGDVGYNGCWRAGAVAEQTGNTELAVHYYRLSKWGPALKRAQELGGRQPDRSPNDLKEGR